MAAPLRFTGGGSELTDALDILRPALRAALWPARRIGRRDAISLKSFFAAL